MLPFRLWIRILRPRWLIIALSGYLAVMGLSSLLVLKPPMRKYNEILEKQVGLDDTYVNLIAFDVESAIDIIERDLEGLRRLSSDFDSRLLRERSYDSILATIKGYCSRTKLRVSELQSTDQTIRLHPGYEKRILRVTLQGKFSDFLKFLEKLESNPEWILIENFTIVQPERLSVTKFDLALSLLTEKQKV